MVLGTIDFLLDKFFIFPWKSLIIFAGILCLPIVALNVIYGLIISPLICEFYIVPGIEKKTGKNLGYSPLLSYAPGGRWFDRDIEISTYILNRYYAFKKYGERSLPVAGNRLALKQIGYTIDMVSKGELIFSFLVRINLYASAISIIIATIAAMLR